MFVGTVSQMRRYLLALGILALFSCTDDEGASNTLRRHGFKNVSLTGYEPWLCGKSTTCTGFEATSPSGERVTGGVGCGLGGGCSKGCAIYLESE